MNFRNRKRVQRTLDKYQQVPDAIPGIVGTASGVVSVPNRANYIYVQVLGNTIEALNVKVAAVAGMHVFVGHDPLQPRLWQVLSQHNSFIDITGIPLPTISPHHETHEYPIGSDIVYSQLRQFMPFRVAPAGGLFVSVYRGIVYGDTHYELVQPAAVGLHLPAAATLVDLTSYVPSTVDKSVLVLITIDKDGSIIVTDGSDIDTSTIALSDIPNAPVNTRHVLAAVRLYYGQTEIIETIAGSDIIDLRFPMRHFHNAGEIEDLGSAILSDVDPQPLGLVSPGVGTEASRDDHIHPHGYIGSGDIGGDFHPLADTGQIGFMPILSDDSTKFLNGQGNWIVPELNLSSSAPIELSSDAGWCWFADPRGIYADNKTFFGYINKEGHVILRQYDHITKILSSEFDAWNSGQIDDHDNPSFLIRASDQKLLAFYNYHDGPNEWMRVSTNALDATAWETAIDVKAQAGGYAYDYPNPVQLTGETNNPIYLFFRNSGASRAISYTKSTDGGVTWAAYTNIWAAAPSSTRIVYPKVVQNGNNRIDFFFSDGHPYNDGNVSLYHFYMMGGHCYKSDGTLITDAAIYYPADATKVYNGSSISGWNWDIAIEPVTGYPVVVFARFPSTTDHRYMYGRWNGTNWDVNEICHAGKYMDDITVDPTSVHYSGGVILDHSNPSIVYASVEIGTSDVWEIYQYRTHDGGFTWNNIPITSGSSDKNIRPFVPRNHPDDYTVMWNEGSYIQNGDWNLKLNYYKKSLIGDMTKVDYDTNNDGIVDNSDRVDGKHASDLALAVHTHNASAITAGILNSSRLGTGAEGSGSKFLADNGTWRTGSGELLMQEGVSGPPVPITNETEDDWVYDG